MLVATQHVAERGYARATLKEIARSAGITAGTLYHYFPSKVDLVISTFREIVDQVFPDLEAAASRADTFPEMLAVMLEAALDVSRDYPHLPAFHASIGVAGKEHPVLAELYDSALRAQQGMLERLVTRAERSGTFPPGVQPQAVADMLFAVLRGLTELAMTVPAPRHRAAVQCTEQWLRGGVFATTVGTDSDTASSAG